MIPSAYLRVFRPLDSFPPDERRTWERFIADGGAPPTARPIYRDEPTQGPFIGMLSSAQGEHADIRVEEGRHWVCPWRTRLRILASIISLRDTAPAELAEAYVPESHVRRAARELARLRRRDPSAAPSILQSPWHVPVRWFLLVDENERRLTEVRPDEFRLSYWTPLPLARRRVERALSAIRRTDLAPLAPMVRELAQWLTSFDPASAVELDYAEVSNLFSWDELDNDHSAQEIQESVEALGGSDGMARAAELYQGVANRWADAMSRESLN